MSLTTNLTAFWKLENTTDSVGSNTLTNTGGVTFAAAKLGNGAFTDGSSYLTSGSNIGISGNGTRTVSFWGKLAAVPAGACFVGWGSNSANTDFSVLSFSGNWYISGSASDIDTGVTADTSIHHHCVTSDGTTTNYYLDGVNIKSQAKTWNTTNNVVSMLYRTDNSDLHASNGSWIDEIGIWSRALSADEVTSLYNSGAGNQYPFTASSNSANFFAIL